MTKMTAAPFIRCALLILFFSGCSAPRTTIITSLKENTFKSFSLESVKLSHTLANASSVSGHLQELERITSKLLNEKGYELTSQGTADGVVTLIIEADNNDSTTSDELRMMKGMHGSKFPLQNPRARNLESDFLIFNILSSDGGRTLYSAKCQLIKGQDQLSNPGTITLTSLSECLREVITPL